MYMCWIFYKYRQYVKHTLFEEIGTTWRHPKQLIKNCKLRKHVANWKSCHWTSSCWFWNASHEMYFWCVSDDVTTALTMPKGPQQWLWHLQGPFWEANNFKHQAALLGCRPWPPRNPIYSELQVPLNAIVGGEPNHGHGNLGVDRRWQQLLTLCCAFLAIANRPPWQKL